MTDDAHTTGNPAESAIAVTPVLDGSWERSGRSPNTAAIVALLGIGALYFNVQSVLMTALIFTGELIRGTDGFSGTMFERATQFMRSYAFPIQLLVFITQYVLLLLPALWLVRRWHSSSVRQYIRLRNVPAVEVLLAVVGTVLLMPATNWIADMLLKQLHIPDELFEMNSELFTAHSPAGFVWLIVVICLTPAICEETLFRGYLQRTFERTIGWKSVVVVGILFGLYHFQPLGLISLSMIGMLLGFFYYRSRSLIPGMAAHFTNNFISILTLYLSVLYPDAKSLASTGAIPFWIVAVTIPLEALVIVLYVKVTSGRASAEPAVS